jgi:cytochrome c peroxidase
MVLGSVALAGAAALAGCRATSEAPYEWALPAHVAPPAVPAANPMTVAKVELGRQLFYEPRLSGNGTMACGSCHQQAHAFTDGRPSALGSTGQAHPRGTMGLANVAFAPTLTWANDALTSLEDQALVPMLSPSPVELGLGGKTDAMLASLRADARYVAAFADAFPNDPSPVSLLRIVEALASFERSLVAASAPYDRFLEGEAAALDPGAQRGRDLFFSSRLRCGECHAGWRLTDDSFRNNGLYASYPATNPGLFAITGKDGDRGRFKVPSLRNVAVTAPYMHDGSLATLDAVLDHYERANGFALAAEERADVLAFLASLTDSDFLHNPRFSDPHEHQAL